MATGQGPRGGRSRSWWLPAPLLASWMMACGIGERQAGGQEAGGQVAPGTGETKAGAAAPGTGEAKVGEVSPGTGDAKAGEVSPGTGEAKAGEVSPGAGEKADGPAGPVTLRGTVVDLAGAPLAGVAVRVSAVDGPRAEPAGPSLRTDAQGRFELAGVQAGRVRLVIMAPKGGAKEYSQALISREIAGGPVVELGPIKLAPRKLKAGEPVGDLGYALLLASAGAPKVETFTVSAVRPGGPAAAAGLLPGDEIVAVNGEDVTGERRYLYEQLVQVPAGEVVRLGLARGATVAVTAGAPP